MVDCVSEAIMRRKVRVPSSVRTIATRQLHVASAWLVVASGCGVVACESPVQPPTLSYTVGGAVSGLVGSGLMLVNNGGDDLAVSADGPVTFASPVAKGAEYRVTVLTQPTSPDADLRRQRRQRHRHHRDVTTVAVACFMAGSASPCPGLESGAGPFADHLPSGDRTPGPGHGLRLAAA